jgi:cytochrome c553
MRPAATGTAAAVALVAASVACAAPDNPARAILETGLLSQGVPACASCHGHQGQGVPAQNGPRLARLDADYLAAQLDAFASGSRAQPVMGPIARALTPEQRSRIADYMASLPMPPSASPVPTRADTAPGRRLAFEGDWSRDVPPCASCHGPNGEGVGSVTPPLAGQTQAYLFRQLQAFRDGDRRDPLGLMAGVAKRVPPGASASVAAYYAGLPPAGRPAADGAP